MARDEYDQWLRRDSAVGKEVLPALADVDLLGPNRTVEVDHSILPRPVACEDQEPEGRA